MDYNILMNTVVELPEFIRRAEKLLRNPERENLIRYLAANPEAGVLLQGTGGIRKLRWKREGTGKSGGVRVIYYFHSEQYPLFLLTLFGKSEKANISKAERNMLAKLTEELLATYGSKQRGGVR
nr:type II toxin-antitoxin system RelE/ParE family toxin [Candidatus Electrothrix aestuarii]